MNFHPTELEGRASAPFFFSIGNELKYADTIDPNTSTLFRGEIREFEVSPDTNRIAVIADHKFTVIGRDGKVQIIGATDSIFRNFKPLGRSFIRDDDFQWSRDSTSLYFIRDKFYRSKGAQLFSEFGELWRFDVETGHQELVLKPFRAFQIIFGKGPEIYFAVPLANGDLEFERFDGKSVDRIAAPRYVGAPFEDSAGPIIDPLYSFSSVEYMQKVLPGLHIRDDINSQGNLWRLSLDGKMLLETTRYYDWFFGWYACDEMMGSVLLPGNRYFMLKVPTCHNYKGQLLIDTQTGSYETLPKNTRVFITANTKTYPHFRIDSEGITIH